MKYDYASSGKAGPAALALAALVAGCNGGTPMSASPAGSSILPSSAQGLGDDALSPDRKKHRGACLAVTNSQNFNGTAIAKGDYIWFSSVTSFPGNKNAVKVMMRDSKIELSDGIKTLKIVGPKMRLALGSANLKFKFDRRGGGKFGKFKNGKGTFRLEAPLNTSGNDLLNGIAYKVPVDLPGGIQNVTWSAKFYSKSGVQSMHWQWGAAVYTRFSNNYRKLQVKPLDDNHYPPNNSDHAGTPEAFKSFVIGGATGGGGSNYTGGLGPTVNVVPCR